MSWSVRDVAALASGLSAALALGLGCAQSGSVDLTAAGDPSLPGVDASWDPSPGKGKPDSGEPSTEEEGETAPPEDDAGPDVKAPPAQGQKPTQGEVLISEVMYDPAGNEPDSEWIEIHNTASSARTLSGLVLSDGAARTHTIGAGVTLAPGAYGVLVRSKTASTTAKVPSGAIVYEYGAGQTASTGIQLANGATGGISIKDGSTVIAQADFGGWFTGTGASVQLKTLSYSASSSAAGWCLSTASWTTGSDKGTPGAADDCP